MDVGKEDYSPKKPIEGVKLLKPRNFNTLDGSFMEIYRFEKFEHIQANLSILAGKTLKAFHIHKLQSDLFFPLQRLVIGLHDLREDSPTKGASMKFALDKELVFIPCGVAHGILNDSFEDRSLIYFVDKFFNPEDELRIPFDFLGKDFWMNPPG